MRFEAIMLKAGEKKKIRLGPTLAIGRSIGTSPWFTSVESTGIYDLRYVLSDGRPNVDEDLDYLWRWQSNIVQAKFKMMHLVIPIGTNDNDIDFLKQMKEKAVYYYSGPVIGFHLTDPKISLTDFGEKIKARTPDIIPLLIANLRNPRYQMPLVAILKEIDCSDALPWMRELVNGVYPWAGERENSTVWAIAHMMEWKRGISCALRWYNEPNRKYAIKWIREN